MSDTPIDPLEQGQPTPREPGGETDGSTNDNATQESAPEPAVEAPAPEAPPYDSQPPEPAPPVVGLLEGKVMRMTSEKVFVGLDDGRQGFVPIIEFAGQPLPNDGDEISVMIEREGTDADSLVLSKRQADELGFWQSVAVGDTLEGVVTGMNKGGLDIDIGGARAFLPSSHVDTQRMRDISLLIGEHVSCIVSQVDRTTHDIVVSRRKFLEKQRREERSQLLNTLAEGELRTGTVTNITDYGAFVSLGDIHGLLHVNDMSWSHVRNPKEVVSKGQQLELRILKINRDTGKVSLGLKQTKPDPWESAEEKYPKDRRITGRVVRLADFGAFLEIEEGIDALLPLSEMSWSRRVSQPSEIVSVGDALEVVVLKVDSAKRRISVGLKQAAENPWANIDTRFPLNEKVKGRVSNIADFGAFVELTPGVEGLIHISELADKHVGSVADVVSEGQEVEVRVIKIDQGAQRISLSMRSEPRAASADEDTTKAGKKRKRPLRGGLSSHFEW